MEVLDCGLYNYNKQMFCTLEVLKLFYTERQIKTYLDKYCIILIKQLMPILMKKIWELDIFVPPGHSVSWHGGCLD